MTTPYERAVESLRAVSHQMDAADLSASDLVMAMVAVNAMNAEIAGDAQRLMCPTCMGFLRAALQPKETDRE